MITRRVDNTPQTIDIIPPVLHRLKINPPIKKQTIQRIRRITVVARNTVDGVATWDATCAARNWGGNGIFDILLNDILILYVNI